MGFSSKDLSQIEEKGIKPEEVEQQIAIFKRGNVVVNIREAATLRNGISSYSDQEKSQLINLYDSRKDDLDILKFVPASGAATRMFKAFYNFLNEYDTNKESVEEYIDRKNNSKLEMFFGRLPNLPFYNDVLAKARENNPHFDDLSEDEQQVLLVRTMLNPEGLNLGDLPKGLVPFHKYENHVATAFEEHLFESVDYLVSKGQVKVHFTVAEEHRQKFEHEYERIKQRLEKDTGVDFDISYSYQDAKTDTIAVDSSNEPFRDETGRLFFRPGGHGALIGNLNERNEDLVFLKNIDNVVTPRYRQVVAENKKMLAGKLLELQEKTFEYLRMLEEGGQSEEELDQMINFLQKELNSGLSIEFDDLDTQEVVSALKRKFNRPIRVCGMVKNEGEPGGGPFWITHQTGEISLQIVESSQIDHDNYQQSKIASEATHFNPVDIVCGLKNFKGKPFDLHQYVDQSTSFIANKTKDGKEIKALELPGLWNGAMADWITIFAEVPVETFNPVKTVADLLKPTHQVR